MSFLEFLTERYGEPHRITRTEFDPAEINALLEAQTYPFIMLDISLENQATLKKIKPDRAYRHIVSFRFGFYLLILKE